MVDVKIIVQEQQKILLGKIESPGENHSRSEKETETLAAIRRTEV